MHQHQRDYFHLLTIFCFTKSGPVRTKTWPHPKRSNQTPPRNNTAFYILFLIIKLFCWKVTPLPVNSQIYSDSQNTEKWKVSILISVVWCFCGHFNNFHVCLCASVAPTPKRKERHPFSLGSSTPPPFFLSFFLSLPRRKSRSEKKRRQTKCHLPNN